MRRTLMSAIGMMAFAVLVQAQQTQGPPVQQLISPSLAGADLYRTYCSTCHGRGGKGDGEVANRLKTPPADLTLIARRNGGTFPRQRIEDFIAYGDVTTAAHGEPDMPIWAPIFAALAPSPEKLVTIRIENLVTYLESIQVK